MADYYLSSFKTSISKYEDQYKMKKPLFLFFLCFVFPALSLFASPYDMILVGDPVLEDLRYLSLESGDPFLSFSPPLAPHEIKQYLDTLDPYILSLPAQEAYKRVKTRLSPEAALSFSSNTWMQESM